MGGNKVAGSLSGGEAPCCRRWGRYSWGWCFCGGDDGGGDERERRETSLPLLRSPWMRSSHDLSAGPVTEREDSCLASEFWKCHQFKKWILPKDKLRS